MSENLELQKPSTKKKNWLRTLGTGLLILITLPFFYYLTYFIFRGPLPTKPQLIAHRGGPVYQPENTLVAFKNAIDLEFDWIEFDVQRTKDGVLVVFHDETVDRTTDGTGRVENLTFEQLRALDAGNGEVVPTFQEVIVLAKKSGTGILPEAKSPYLYPGIATQMTKELIEHSYLENAVIQSFDYSVLEEVNNVQKETHLCPLYGLWKLDLSDPTPGNVGTICPMAEMVILNPWMIKQAHDDGREVFVWFGDIEHPITARLLIAMGTDGLMVDDPIMLANIVLP